MNEELCKHRDDYLLDEWESDRRAEFEQHLSSCDSCRAYIESQARIDRMLRNASNSLEVPAHLAARIETKLTVVRRRQRTFVAALVAMPVAAGLFVLFYFATQQHLQPDPQKQIVRDSRPSEHQPERNAIVENERAEPETAPVEVEVSGDVIAMQIESGDPNVTLIQIFEVKPYEHGRRK
jgi:anti-sigma factor RsiW